MIRRLHQFYRQIFSSIAFLPAVISLVFFFLALFSLYMEFSTVGSIIKNHMEVLLVKGNDNARQVLGALIGGIISLTVFSFSMVMVVINQAASGFTPRAIPGVVTDKKNQFILGFYVGTIIYSVVMILNVRPGEGGQNSPQIGVLLAMLFGIICLFLFIYFIHFIAQMIQVDSIIASSTRDSIKTLQKAREENPVHSFTPDTSRWHTLGSPHSGYLSEINEKKLRGVCSAGDLQVEMLYAEGAYLVKGEPICKVNRNLDDQQKLRNSVLLCFHFTNEPYGPDSYLQGVNQISEIAVKALSPGINDPGTATIALDHLTEIFACLLSPRPEKRPDAGNEPVLVIRKERSLNELLFNFIVPIRTYGEKEPRLHLKLLHFYGKLIQSARGRDAETLRTHLLEELESIEENITVPSQKELLNEKIVEVMLIAEKSVIR